MGVVELLLITVVTCLSLGITSPTVIASELLVPISKPACQDKCGNVSVPFPFGMGSSKCFLDGWFEMVCNKSVTPNRLFSNRLQLEVLNITFRGDAYSSYEQQIQVRAPISFFNCQDKEIHKTVNLTGAPFSFSDNNVFVAVSCGVPAMMNSSSGNIFSQIGCTSKCSLRGNKTAVSNDHQNVLCDGTDCCQTSINTILDSFQISFDNTTAEKEISDHCKFALMVDRKYWLDYQNHSSSFASIGNMDYVPVILDWYLANYSYFDIFRTNMPKSQRSTGANCYNSSYYYSTNANPGTLRCGCTYGLRGNPYLLEGCSQDINECETWDRPCGGSGATCVNTFGSYHCSNKRKFILIGFGSALGALFLLFGIWGLYKTIKKRKEARRKKRFFKQNGGLLLQQQLSFAEGNVEKTKVFDSNELEKATDHFSADRFLGQGGQGTVYKGMLEDGKIVAVKKSKIVDESKLLEFINEVVILSQINHRNVVQLLGCCLETEVPLLVYEFIPNGTLSQYIHDRNEEFPFTWKMRLRIATEVAGALSYLHSAASFPIYHRDIKSTNILLDEKYRAKVADFGTSRTISIEQSHLTTLVYGTFGYLDPEYFQSSQFTEKSDVYSFGVVLVELLTGQKAISAARAEEGRNLATYFTMLMEANRLFDILDAQVLEDGPKEEIFIVACLALRCLNLNGRNRPTMKEVAMELDGIQKSERVAPSNAQQSHEEIKYVRTELIEPWDAASMSTGSVLDNSTTRSSLLQELPLLSFE